MVLVSGGGGREMGIGNSAVHSRECILQGRFASSISTLNGLDVFVIFYRSDMIVEMNGLDLPCKMHYRKCLAGSLDLEKWGC